MVEFQIRTLDTPQVRECYVETVERLKNPDAKRNPYNSRLLVVKRNDELLGKFKMESLYPPIDKLVVIPLLMILAVVVFGWPKWLLIVFGAITLILAVFRLAKSAQVHFLGFKEALRRKGYTGMVKLERIGLEGWILGTDRDTRILEKTEDDG